MRDVIDGNAPVGGNDGNGGVIPVVVVSFTCPRCGATSHHPADAEAGYCGACHDWTGERAGTLGPVCSACPPGAEVHASCAAARQFADGDAWLFLGRTVSLEELPG